MTKIIKNHEDLKEAQDRLDVVWYAKSGEKDFEERYNLIKAIVKYEDEHFEIDLPTEEEAQAFRKDQEMTDDNSLVEYWDHDKSVGFRIHWSGKGTGFGTYDFFVDKKDGKLKIDNETIGRKIIKKTLDGLLDEEPEEVRKILHMLVDMGELRDKFTSKGKEIK